MIMIPADDKTLRKELTTFGNLKGFVRSARKRNDLLFDQSIPDSQKVRLLANEDQSYDVFRNSIQSMIPLVRTVKDKKRKGNKQWIKKQASKKKWVADKKMVNSLKVKERTKPGLKPSFKRSCKPNIDLDYKQNATIMPMLSVTKQRVTINRLSEGTSLILSATSYTLFFTAFLRGLYVCTSQPMLR